MSTIEILPFTAGDVPFGKRMTDSEGWHRTEADWRRLIRLEPTGVVKATLDGRDVGTAGVLSYGSLAWVHSIIVLPELRGTGVGSRLMQWCVDRAVDLGCVTVKLDSVNGVEGFYRRFGFVEEFESKRYTRDGGWFPVKDAHLTISDLDDVIAFDRAMVGIDRGRVIRAVVEDGTEAGFVARDEGRISGYVLARGGEERFQVGPCVATDELVAKRLLKSLIGSAPVGTGFRMCVAGDNAPAVRLAEELGFHAGISPTRMRKGKPAAEAGAAFAMVSAEKG
jgi:GNAT superfamily N-acetyltransferase